MYKLASCCLLFMGCLNALFSLPVPGSREEPLLFSEPSGGAGPALDEGDRVSLLLGLLGVSDAGTGGSLRKADPDTNVFNPRGITRKALSGQEPNILLNHLLATIRKQFKKRGHPSECFWKYCV